MKNYVFQLLHGIKNIFSKHVVPITYGLGKMFFTVATFESLLIVSLQSKKLVVYFGLCVRVFFGFSEKRRANKYCR